MDALSEVRVNGLLDFYEEVTDVDVRRERAEHKWSLNSDK